MTHFSLHSTAKWPSQTRCAGYLRILSLAVLAALAAGAQTPALAYPTTITLSASYGHPGATVKVSGSGFGAYEAVDIYFDTTDEALAVTTSSGTFSKIPVTAPTAALPGPHFITGIGRQSGRAAQAEFDVYTDWPQYSFDAKKKGNNPYENVINTGNVSGLDLDWSYQTGISGDVFTDPVAVVDGTVYGTSYDGQVFALNGATGAPVWTFYNGEQDYTGVAVSGGNVFTCFGPVLYALSATTGASVWSASLENHCILAPPTVANGTVYTGDNSGNIYAFDATTGSETWSVNIGQAAFYGATVANDLVYVENGSTLYALNADNGSTVWSTAPSGGFASSPAVASGYVFFGTGSRDLVALRAESGASVWNLNLPDYPLCSPVVGPRQGSHPLVYFGTLDGTLYAISASAGAIEWQASGACGGYPGAIANGLLYMTEDGSAEAIDARDGELDWSGSTGNYNASTTVANGMVYVPSQDGNLYAFAINGGDDRAYKRHGSAPKISSLHPDYDLKPQYTTP